LQAALAVFRLWPADESTAAEFADLFQQLRSTGKTMSQFDLLIAAVARQHKLILLTADGDFARVNGITVENWL
jgi:predicted nucleic acid-binding protein